MTELPDIYKSRNKNSVSSNQEYLDEEFKKMRNEIMNYINSKQYEIFHNEDIFPLNVIKEIQLEIDNCIKYKQVVNSIQVTDFPTTHYDVVNKEYLDFTMKKVTDELNNRVMKGFDIDMNHFKILNVPYPKNPGDAATKEYVDDITKNLKYQYINSKCTVSHKKTYYFDPGFVCPHDINIMSVGFVTSSSKFNYVNKAEIIKLYFMKNDEIKSEVVIEKDNMLGFILKEFDTPIIFDKGDNLMMYIDGVVNNSSVNIMFY